MTQREFDSQTKQGPSWVNAQHEARETNPNSKFILGWSQLQQSKILPPISTGLPEPTQNPTARRSSFERPVGDDFNGFHSGDSSEMNKSHDNQDNASFFTSESFFSETGNSRRPVSDNFFKPARHSFQEFFPMHRNSSSEIANFSSSFLDMTDHFDKFSLEQYDPRASVGSRGSNGSQGKQPQIASNLYKTELCKSFVETGACRYGNKCQFAHGVEELRGVCRGPKYKTKICKKFHTHGYCNYGTRCTYIHISPHDDEKERTKNLLANGYTIESPTSSRHNSFSSTEPPVFALSPTSAIPQATGPPPLFRNSFPASPTQGMHASPSTHPMYNQHLSSTGQSANLIPQPSLIPQPTLMAQNMSATSSSALPLPPQTNAMPIHHQSSIPPSQYNQFTPAYNSSPQNTSNFASGDSASSPSAHLFPPQGKSAEMNDLYSLVSDIISEARTPYEH